MVLAHLVAPHRWRGLRSFVLSRPFAEKLSPASRAKEIYPIHPPNPAVFEESLGDIPVVWDTAKSRLQVLQNVVAKRDWTLATRLRDEMLENGQHIPLDSVYEEGAIASLSLPQSFSKWLQLYPNAENGPSNPLTSLRATLLHSTSVDPSLVFEFGLIIAEKGYHSIVRQEILPHISRAAGTDAMTARLKTLLLPSVLSPSPSSSFLEDEDLVDYTAFVPTPWAQPDNRVHSGDILTHLQSLLQDRKLIQAEIVLREIQDLGIDIPSSLIYLKAAETVLHPEYRGELPFQHFEKWFSLVPACHESPLEEFTTVRQRIFWSPATNMHLVIPFLLVCARKGYFGILTQHMDALRYAADDVVLSVYTDMQHHSKAYLTSLNKRESSVPAMLRKLHRRILSVLSKANRHELAARVLHSADAEVVSPLLSVLSKDNLSTIEPGASSPKKWADSHSEERLEDLLQLASFSSVADKFQTDTPMVFDTPREYLMYLRGIATQRRVPHPHTLMDFYTTYTDSGRTRAIDLLRTRYFRLNYPAASILLWTEMVADYREEQYLQVLSTFCHNFYMAGVPRAKVVTALKNMPPGRHRAIPSRGKLYPLPIQSALIWQCLASLETHLDSLEKLYWELLDACRGKYQVGPHDMFKGVNEINNPAWKGLPVAESAFTPFLKKLMRHSGVSRGIRMLNDMAEVGLAPTIYHYTEVAAYAAKIRDNRTAFFILEKMEESWGVRPEAEIDASHLQEDYMAFDFTLDDPKETDGTWDTASEEVPSPPAGTNPSGTLSPPVKSFEDASPSINVPSNAPTNAALTPEISAEPLFVDTIASPSLGISETTLSKEVPASPVDVSAPISPPHSNPSFVFYVAVMRGFLMSREMAALQEVHNHFLRFYDPETLDDEHLNLLYDDWRTVLAGERYPTRLPKRVLNMLQNE